MLNIKWLFSPVAISALLISSIFNGTVVTANSLQETNISSFNPSIMEMKKNPDFYKSFIPTTPVPESSNSKNYFSPIMDKDPSYNFL